MVMPTPNAQWLALTFVLAMLAIWIAYDVLIIHTDAADASISGILSRLLELPSTFVVLVY
jgi:hypothetical protein